MRTVRVFISYARVDGDDADYVRSLLDGVGAFAPPVGVSESLKAALNRAFARPTARDHARERTRDPRDPRGERGAPDPTGLTPVTLRAWMDEESRSKEWNDTIQRAIEGSGCFVVLVPERGSTFVNKECALAIARGLPIVPLARSRQDLRAYRLDDYPALKWPSESQRWSQTFVREVRDRIAGLAV